ncbi:putative baseplate assembly protein [Amycolatopsis jejuensis]|uniref:putative baseplate assembly protein n=1 Tax=Amycolatopsis jejuensis TaxID=330084 RepID=UPI00068E4E16|nr:putative baseplate assembly protein [Amycolatopsis jejuensis]
MSTLYNRPGLPAISRRIGTYARFRQSMMDRLATIPALTTRDSDDPSIALLDCWAIVGDVLTFYQERIANEGYLRTATEPESLTHLGKLVGYTPRPALSATTYLAYTLDPGAKTVIPAGTGAKSVPGQNQLPQTFETVSEIQAREEWNALRVATAEPVDITSDTARIVGRLGIEGTTAGLKAGDRLLLLFGTFSPVVRVVADATTDFPAGRTSVTLTTPGGFPDELNRAIIDLSWTITLALGHHPGPSPWIDDTIDSLTAAKSYLDGLGSVRTVTYVLLRTIYDLGTELAEQAALARAHASCPIRDWFKYSLKPVEDATAVLRKLCVAARRENDPEVRYLNNLAKGLYCTPPAFAFSDGPQTGCDRAAALIGLTPVLPWLRREPSRPPRRAVDLQSTVDELFHPSSDVHPKLLVAADQRLAPSLHKAWANEQISPPPKLSDVQVLRVRAVAEARPVGAIADAADTTAVWLDAVYDGIARDSWVVLEAATGEQSAARVLSVRQEAVDVKLPDGKPAGTKQVTVITLNDVVSPVPVAGTVVWARGEMLAAIGDPITEDVHGDEIELARLYDGLRPGRWLVVSGERTDVPHTSGVQAAELTMVAGIRQRVNPDRAGDRVRTFLSLTTSLSYRYRRDTVTVHGNVVEANQGETRTEVLGSGDPGVPSQTFPLRQSTVDNPLTFLPSANASGAESTLAARVSGVRWHETDGLVWSGPTSHEYEMDTGQDGTRTLRFGDGVHGARIPAGVENVTARYRVGAGHDGNVAAGQINQASGRPPGVRAVTNPLASGGGADGDGPADARATIPLRMLALDRLVSIRDYEDFTRARAGIGKAKAVKLSDGGRRVVHVTVAAIGDARIDMSSGLVIALEEALAGFGDRGIEVRVAVRERVLLVLRAGIKVLPDYSWDLVEPAVRAALLDEFSFTHRELGEPAFLSEAFAAIQKVPGVDYADIDVFDGIRGDVTPIELATMVDRLSGARACVEASGARFEEAFDEVGYVDDFGTDTLTTIALRHGLTVDELVRLNPRLSSTTLKLHQKLAVSRGIRPARLAVLPPDVPEALTLVRIP